MVSGKPFSETYGPCGAGQPGSQGLPGAEARVIESSALFGEARTVSIRHGAELYTLRITRADKLILTK